MDRVDRTEAGAGMVRREGCSGGTGTGRRWGKRQEEAGSLDIGMGMRGGGVKAWDRRRKKFMGGIINCKTKTLL